jgi:hypothetical protein
MPRAPTIPLSGPWLYLHTLQGFLFINVGVYKGESYKLELR